MLVGGAQRLAVVEVDLVLAEVALALGVLDHHPRAGHVVADPADERLHPGGAQQRVVDVVEVGRLEVAVAAAPRVLVGVAEHHELELGARHGGEPALGQAVELAAQDLPRRGHDVAAVLPLQVGHHQHRGRCHGMGRSVSMSGFIWKSP